MFLIPGAKENEISSGYRCPSRIHNLDSARERYGGETKGNIGSIALEHALLHGDGET